MEETQKHNKYIVLVPFPLQGHMTPMLQLASILHLKGFSIIVAHTKLNPPDPSNHKDFILLSMGESLSDHYDSMDPASRILIMNSNCMVPLEQSLVYFIKQNPQFQVSCIIYDPIMYCAQDVASRMNLPSIILHTSNVSSSLACSALLQFHEDGCFPFQDSMLLEPVPQLYSIRFKELGLLNGLFGDFKKLQKLEEIFGSNEAKSSAGIWNSMDHLESHSLAQFQHQYQVPSFAIGPLHKIAPTISTSLLSEDKDCMRWLNNQPKNSVLYLSLGSLATMEPSELTEMACGLANSGQPFLWVVRPGSVIGSDWIEHLPEGFKERVGDRGCIVKWAPQKEVLSHDSVGGFWSHCGWNSALESICEGVPMICRPVFGDQWVDARYITDVWKMGLEMEGELDREKIEKGVRRLMQDTEGEQLRRRGAALKEMSQMTNLAMAEGGTSSNALNLLVELLLSF